MLHFRVDSGILRSAPFRKTLNRVGPTHVIVTGFRPWDHLPGDEDFWSDASEDEAATIRKLVPNQFKNCKHERQGWLGRYRHGSGKCLVVKIKHPSRGFSPAQRHPEIRDFRRRNSPLEISSRKSLFVDSKRMRKTIAFSPRRILVNKQVSLIATSPRRADPHTPPWVSAHRGSL